jgi:hypothetical protein
MIAAYLVFLPCNWGSNGCLLQGAKHAVLRTLYSRAHRIGLDGISYLLGGLCENLSLDLFWILVVNVLV